MNPKKINAKKGEASNISAFPYAEWAIIFLTGDKMGSVTIIINCFSLLSFGITTSVSRKRNSTKPYITRNKMIAAVLNSIHLLPYFAQGKMPLLCISSLISPRISTLFGAARKMPEDTF